MVSSQWFDLLGLCYYLSPKREGEITGVLAEKLKDYTISPFLKISEIFF